MAVATRMGPVMETAVAAVSTAAPAAEPAAPADLRLMGPARTTKPQSQTQTTLPMQTQPAKAAKVQITKTTKATKATKIPTPSTSPAPTTSPSPALSAANSSP